MQGYSILILWHQFLWGFTEPSYFILMYFSSSMFRDVNKKNTENVSVNIHVCMCVCISNNYFDRRPMNNTER